MLQGRLLSSTSGSLARPISVSLFDENYSLIIAYRDNSALVIASLFILARGRSVKGAGLHTAHAIVAGLRSPDTLWGNYNDSSAVRCGRQMACRARRSCWCGA